MYRILIAQCEQEVSSFNPVFSEYELFEIHRGTDLVGANEGQNTAVGGALGVFGARRDVEVVPAYGAFACSAGPLSGAGFARLSGELLGTIRERADGIDGVYFCLHGAMEADGELDPEGYLLEETRRIVGPDVPIVISLDLHGILTDRMLRHCNGAAIYHTYPHEDFVDTGERAARMLLDILDGEVRPVTARVRVPALVRGPELMTKSGLFGGIVAEAMAAEGKDSVLAAAFMIGNPFTDVPELCSQPVVTTNGDPSRAVSLALKLAGDFWAQRERMQAELHDLDAAVAEAKTLQGAVTFSDPADAPSSGASGDSVEILAGLIRGGYRGRVLAPLVDPRAVEAAFAAGVGAMQRFRLGGVFDSKRFRTIELEATVDMLSRGQFTLEQWGNLVEAGPTAVLKAGNVTLVVVSRPIFMLDRSLFYAHGQDPQRFDLTIIKSPGAYARYYTWAERNYNLDVPGATSANLKSLGHKVCARPMFPLDEEVEFVPSADVYGA